MPVSAWPPPRAYFAALSGFFTGAVGAFGTVQTQLAGKAESVTTMAWLTILGAGILGAFAAGKLTWDAWNAAQATPPSVPPFGTKPSRRETHHG